MENIDGRTAFVTGASSGIGLAVSEALVAAGARVVLADRYERGVHEAAARLGERAFGVRLDVTDRAGWAVAARLAESTFGPVDILVNNAGVAPGRYHLADMPPEHFDQLVAIMLTGVFNGIHTFVAGMVERGEGHVVNTASLAGLLAYRRQGAYATSKFGVVGMSEVLAAEVGPAGVGVSILCPGPVDTNLGLEPGQVRTGPSPLDGGMAPAAVAELVLGAIRENELYVMTHGEYGTHVAERAERIVGAFDRAPRPADTPGGR